MTIRKGEAWGVPEPAPAGLNIAGSDRELAALVATEGDAPFAVTGGDVFTTIGAPVGRARAYRLSMDVLRVEADGVPHLAVAHVLVRRRMWWGRVVAAFNVDHMGKWNVAPRAHPNDGRFDIIEVSQSMSVRDRRGTRRRLPAGTHTPHPEITTRTATEASWRFERPHLLWIDGAPVGSVRELTVTIEPDAYALYI